MKTIATALALAALVFASAEGCHKNPPPNNQPHQQAVINGVR